MIAVKYKEEFLSLDTPFNWPVKIKKPVDILPEGYDVLLDQVQYDQLITDNQSIYEAHLAAEEAKKQLYLAAGKFRQIRDKWQQLADEYAAGNVATGITTAQAKVIADGFNSVKYYLETNVPMQAIAEIDNVPTDSVYLTVEKRNAMKEELLSFIQQVFNI